MSDTDGPSARTVRTVFFGSGSFAVPILEAVAADPGFDVVAVVTVPDRPVGRRGDLAPTPVAARAAAMGLPILRPERLGDGAVADDLAGLDPDLGVLADYGRIVPADLIAVFPHGVLNVHPSLLPRHRGATPIPAAIAAGDATTGVTIIAMDAGLDTGPIVAQEAWPLTGHETTPDLEVTAAIRGAALLARTLGPFFGGELIPVPQDHAAGTLTRPFRREDGRLDPGLPAVALERRVRAGQPWPGAFVETDGGRLAVLAASVAADQSGDRVGRIVRDGDRPALVTTDGRLVLDKVVPAGGRPMPGADHLRGHPDLVGRIVLQADGSPALASDP